MKLRRLVLPVSVAMTLAMASPALARDFFVSPGSTGQGTCDAPTASNDCSLQWSLLVSNDHDDITLAPGTYTLDGTLQVLHSVVIHGTAGQPRPVITLDDADTYATMEVVAFGAVLRHVEITAGHLNPLAGTTLVLHDSTIQDSVVRAATTGTSAVTISDGSAVRNSVVHRDGVGVDGVVALRGNNELRNVTISGVPDAGRSVIARCLDQEVGGTLSIINTIAMPSSSSGVTPPATLTADGANCKHGFYPTVEATSSSFDRADVTAGGTFNDKGFNVKPATLATDGVHEVAGSSTIDAGKVDALSAIDFDGDARVIGSAVDIGADEFVPPVAPAPPATPVTPAAPAALPPPITPQFLNIAPIPNGLSGLTATGTKTTSKIPPTIHFTLSSAQKMNFKISALLSGRLRGGKCISPAGKKGTRCTAVRSILSGTITAARGINNVALLSRGSTQLSPGLYRVTISPNGQSAKTAEFRVTSGSAKKKK